MDTLIAAAGPMALASGGYVDTFDTLEKLNLDFFWEGDTVLSASVKSRLDTIKQNFRPHPNCYVKLNYPTIDPNAGWLYFPHENVMNTDYLSTVVQSQERRILYLYKYWNILRYFNPYNHIIDVPLDTTLLQKANKIATATTAESYWRGIEEIAVSLNDVHVFGLTRSIKHPMPFRF